MQLPLQSATECSMSQGLEDLRGDVTFCHTLHLRHRVACKGAHCTVLLTLLALTDAQPDCPSYQTCDSSITLVNSSEP